MRLFFSILFCVITGIAYSQSRVEGMLRDVSGAGIDGAIIKISADSSVIAYAISDKGHFNVAFNTGSRKVKLIAESMGYESVENEILNISQTCNITMKEKATALKEVVVKAPAIYQLERRPEKASGHKRRRIGQYQIPGERYLKLLHRRSGFAWREI